MATGLMRKLYHCSHQYLRHLWRDGGGGPGDALTVHADAQQDSRSPNLELLLLGGSPLRAPVVFYGPFVMNIFVMNIKEEIVPALSDYQAGRMGAIPATVLCIGTN
jgi:hypothetical protein